MVGHDAPRVQVISFTVEMKKGVLDIAGDLWMAQRTTPHPGIQPSFDFLSFGRFATALGHGADFLFQHTKFFFW